MKNADRSSVRGSIVVGRRMVSFIALMGCLGGAPDTVGAQQRSASPLTLSDAVDLAVHNHPAIREASAGSAAALADVAVARTAYLPRLDFLWQTNRATRNNVFGLLLPQPVLPPISGPVLDTESLDGVWGSAGGILLSWEVVDFGRRRAGVDLARAESGAADAQRTATELDIAGAAADAYLGVLAADAARDAAVANVERLDIFATSVRALVHSQLRAGAEQSRAEAELAVARNRLADARKNAELARIALAEAIGAPGARPNLAPGGLLQVPARPPATAFDPASHPRAVAADAQADAVRARDRVLERSYFPRVELQTALSGRGVSQTASGTADGNGLALEVPNWAVGVSVTFPSLEVFRTHAKRRAEAERLGEATAHYDRTLQAVQTREARARAVIAAAYEIAANTPEQLRAAREGDVQARARYTAGLTSVLEVAEAQRLLAEAEAENAVAHLAVWRALLAEAVLTGDLQPFLQRTRGAESPSKQIP
jgi:outer membrane protein